MSLPEGAILNAMKREQVDISLWELDWEESQASQRKTETEEENGGPPMKDDPHFEKCWKMGKMGLPEGAILNAVQRDQVDASLWVLDCEKSLASQKKPETKVVGSVPPNKDDSHFLMLEK